MKNQSQLLESIDTFKISFGGKNTIDALIFSKAINNTIELVKASANAVDPSCFLRLEIKANNEGSFVTVIDAVIRYAHDLFTAHNISAANQIVSGFVKFLEIKKHLFGNKPKKIEKQGNDSNIVNQSNESLKVPQSIADAFFKDCQIDNLVINIIHNVQEGNRDQFAVETTDEKVAIVKSEYNVMSIPVVDDKDSYITERQKPIEVNLLLKKPDLLGNSQWEFVFNKNISAKILDNEFLEKVHKGQIKKLYAGVRIPCLLLIEYDLDEYFNPIPNSDRYTVTQVTGDIIEPIVNASFL